MPGWRKKIALFIVSCLIIAALFGIGELYCRLFTRINFLDNSRGLFTANRYGKSFGNTPNFHGISFGQEFFTDADGFRIDPQLTSSSSNSLGVLLLGDSVSFGPAVPEDKTIAGRLQYAMPGQQVLNASTIGWDAFDYRNAAKAIIAEKPQIKSIALFFCLNDLNEASARAIRDETNLPDASEGLSIIRELNDFLRSRSKLYLWLKNALRDTQMIHLQHDLSYYQKGEEFLSNGLAPLAEIKRETDAAGIQLKVFLLPYEAQIRPNGPPEYLEPQRLISNFLGQNGIEHYDLTPEFQKTGADAKYLFLYGDPMHLSEQGHELTAKLVCEKLLGCKK